MIPLFSYMALPAIFIFVIGHVATAMLPLPKPKLSRKIRIIKFGNHSKTASKSESKSTGFASRDEESVIKGIKKVSKPLFGGKINVF